MARAARRFVRLAASSVEGTTLRLVSYNILADALCMTEKHSYCCTTDREWGNALSGRCSRLIGEIRSYDADVVCLQEVSLRCFQTFSDAFTEFTGFHHATFLSAEDAAAARESVTGLAVFVRSSKWKPRAAKAHRFGALDGARQHTGRLRQKLLALSDAILLLRLESVICGTVVVLGSTHLHWDPHWPQLKVVQAHLAVHALRQFSESGAAHNNSDGRSGGQAPVVVLAGDFNSVPHLQPAFLPEAQRASLPDPLPVTWQPSALYSLLACGHVPADHPEHPTQFGMSPTELPQVAVELAEVDVAAAPVESMSASARPRKKARIAKGAAPPPVGELTCPLALRNTHADALCAGPLPLTTHADDFSGCLDYVWAGGLAEVEAVPTVDVLEVLEMPYNLNDSASFGPIPSADWPSDHLALGVTLGVGAKRDTKCSPAGSAPACD